MTHSTRKSCGTEIKDDSQHNDIIDKLKKQFLNPSLQTSCGGGFFPRLEANPANMSTYKTGVVLPTGHYSVLFFKADGTPVIYADQDNSEFQESDAL